MALSAFCCVGFWDKQGFGLSVFTETLADPLRLQTIYRVKTDCWICKWCSKPAMGPFQKVEGGCSYISNMKGSLVLDIE